MIFIQTKMKDRNLLESPNIKKSKGKTLIILSILAAYALLFLAFGLLVCQSSIFANVYSFMKDVMKKPNKTQPVQDSSNATSVIVSDSTPLFTDDSYLVKTKGCLIPGRNPFDESVKRLIPEPYPIECKTNTGVTLPLVSSNSSAIFVNEKARGLYYNDTDELDCCWRFFKRTRLRPSIILYSKCTPFNDSVAVDREFIKVQCTLPNATVYQDFFSFIPDKYKVEQRSEELQSKSSGKKLSVLVVGMNSVSRFNLHRAMPRTAAALRRIGAIEMLGYNKVGYDSYENVVPILTGLGHEEFDRLYRKNRMTTFDQCPFIWKNYSDKGYRTIFAEDTSTTTIFEHFKPGFRIQPTDYYLRPFWVASEPAIGNARKPNTYACSGTSFAFDRLLNYASSVASKFADKLYFGLFWESITHDFIQDAKLADKSYERFFDQLREDDLLRNTALIFTSDHGMRYNSFRQTYQGRLEENLPFLYVQMPDWWKLENPEAWERLKKNAARLTTPFDLHATLRDILEPQPFGWKENRRKGPGVSLFRRITEERNCESAGIPEHWCTCHHRHDVSRDSAKLAKISKFLVGEINKLLAEEPRCAKVKLSSVVDVKTINDANYQRDLIVKDGYALLRNEKKWNWTEYSVIVKTMPGRGIFEGNVRYEVNKQPQLMGYISRLNDYVDQSSCVNDFSKRYFCNCV